MSFPGFLVSQETLLKLAVVSLQPGVLSAQAEPPYEMILLLYFCAHKVFRNFTGQQFCVQCKVPPESSPWAPEAQKHLHKGAGRSGRMNALVF